LKAPKKAPKGEMDEEDVAFKEKQKAGLYSTHKRAQLDKRGSRADSSQMRKLRLNSPRKQREAKDLSIQVPKVSRRVARNERAAMGGF
jgi:hypothetical protein